MKINKIKLPTEMVQFSIHFVFALSIFFSQMLHAQAIENCNNTFLDPYIESSVPCNPKNYDPPIYDIEIGKGTSYPTSKFIGSLFNLSVHIVGDYNIDLSCGFYNCQITVEPGKKIVVNDNRRLIIDNSTLETKCLMWNGIYLSTRSQLMLRTNTIIRDATIAVTAPFSSSNLNITKTTFDKNIIDMQLGNTANGDDYPKIIAFNSNKFLCSSATKDINNPRSKIAINILSTNGLYNFVSKLRNLSTSFTTIQDHIRGIVVNPNIISESDVTVSVDNIKFMNIIENGIEQNSGNLYVNNTTFQDNYRNSILINQSKSLNCTDSHFSYTRSKIEVSLFTFINTNNKVGIGKHFIGGNDFTTNFITSSFFGKVFMIFYKNAPIFTTIDANVFTLNHQSFYENLEPESNASYCIKGTGEMGYASNFDIVNNNLRMTNYNNSGISFFNGSYNNINISHNVISRHQDIIRSPSNTGIWFGNNSFTNPTNTISNNIILGDNNDGLPFRFKHGINIEATDNTIVCSNLVRGLQAPFSSTLGIQYNYELTSFRFRGFCHETKYSQNIIDGIPDDWHDKYTDGQRPTPLYLDAATVIGVQYWKGNEFHPYLRLLNYAGKAFWGMSDFKVSGTLSPYWPYPSPNTYGSGNWFKNERGNFNFSCDKDLPDLPCYGPGCNFTNTDTAIVEKSIYGNMPGIAWQTNKYLYKKLLKYPEFTQSSSLFNNFKQQIESKTSIDEVIAIENKLSSMQKQNTPLLHSYDNIVTSIQAIANRIQSKSDAIMIAPDAVYGTIENDIISMYDEIDILTANMSNTNTLISNNIKNTIVATRQINKNIASSSIIESNMKDVNEYKLKAWNNESITSSEYENIKNIANQCYTKQGYASFIARSLLSDCDISNFHDDPTCTLNAADEPQLRKSKPTTNNNEISIFPNPTSGELFLSNAPKESKYQIFNNLGILVQNGKLNTNNISMDTNITNGAYYIKIYNDNNEIIVTQKIYIQR